MIILPPPLNPGASSSQTFLITQINSPPLNSDNIVKDMHDKLNQHTPLDSSTNMHIWKTWHKGLPIDFDHKKMDPEVFVNSYFGLNADITLRTHAYPNQTPFYCFFPQEGGPTQIICYHTLGTKYYNKDNPDNLITLQAEDNRTECDILICLAHDMTETANDDKDFAYLLAMRDFFETN